MKIDKIQDPNWVMPNIASIVESLQVLVVANVAVRFK